MHGLSARSKKPFSIKYMSQNKTHCGYAAIIGKPNVGKSTLLNQLIGKKIAITSHKAQTTRRRILGIKTLADAQILYLDTPGLHSKEKNLMNRYMNRAAHSVLTDVDVIIWLIEALKWDEEEEAILKRLANIKTPVILAINKIDQVKDKNKLLPFLDRIKNKFSFAHIIPISAEKNIQLDELEKIIIRYLPESPFCYPETQVTDADDAFIASEMIREKLTRLLGQELPYALTVMIEAIERKEKPFGEQTRHVTGLLSKNGLPATRDYAYYSKWLQDYKNDISKVAKNYEDFEYLENKKSKILIVCFGAVSKPIYELKGNYSIFRPIRMFPVLEKQFKEVADKHDKIIVVEMNDGQYASELKKIIGPEKIHSIPVLGGQISLEEIKKEIEKLK